jgi:hypothetical protein
MAGAVAGDGAQTSTSERCCVNKHGVRILCEPVKSTWRSDDKNH